jgi:CSLREA domain-containing protein
MRNRARRTVSLLAIAALLASTVASTPANAQVLLLPPPRTFTVINNDDADTGACTTTHCTLREAINAANFVPSCLLFQQPCRNTINFQFGIAQPLTVTVTSALPQITGSMMIDGDNLPTFTTVILNGQPFQIELQHPGRVQVIGNSTLGDGLVLAHGTSAIGTLVTNLQVTGFGGAGIHMKSNSNTLTNDSLSGNGFGVLVDSGNNFFRANTVTNNTHGGIGAGSAPGNSIFGNTITGNGGNGVNGGALVVGSPAVTDRNIISGNTACGINGPNTVVGNFIGVDSSGAAAQPNGDGVCGEGMTVGGSAAGAGNVIAGNTGNGIKVDASIGEGNSIIQGNLIGTNAAGTAAVPNGADGVSVTGSQSSVSDSLAPNVSILSNVIAGNGHNGIHIFGGFKHVVQSNHIGTDSSGTASIPNQFNGVFIDDARSVTVGMPLSGGDASQGNVIAHQFGAGVSVFTETQGSVNSVGNTVRGNSISSNNRLGIDLVPVASQIGFGVVTQPSAVHPDNGPNRLQNLPTLTSAVRTTTASGEALVVAGNMFSNLAAGNLLVDVYASAACDTLSGFGQGQQFLGSVVVGQIVENIGGTFTGFGTFATSIPTSPRLADGTLITATVTSTARGDTSEFSKCFVVDSGTGAPRVSPANATTAPEQELALTYTWTLPSPRPWRQLSDLELRLRDADSGEIPFLVRWDQTPNTFSVLNSDSGKFGPASIPGDKTTLANHGVRVDMANAQVVGSGPTGQSVTLTIPLTLNAQFAGHTFIVETAATDDSGQQAGFAPTGTLQVSDR